MTVRLITFFALISISLSAFSESYNCYTKNPKSKLGSIVIENGMAHLENWASPFNVKKPLDIHSNLPMKRVDGNIYIDYGKTGRYQVPIILSKKKDSSEYTYTYPRSKNEAYCRPSWLNIFDSAPVDTQSRINNSSIGPKEVPKREIIKKSSPESHQQ